MSCLLIADVWCNAARYFILYSEKAQIKLYSSTITQQMVAVIPNFGKRVPFISRFTLKRREIEAALSTCKHRLRLQMWTSDDPAPELGHSWTVFTHPPARDWTAAAVPWPYSPPGPSHTPLPHTTSPTYWPLKDTDAHTRRDKSIRSKPLLDMTEKQVRRAHPFHRSP